MSDIQARIVEYLDLGGFFNPEAMNHDKVRTLIMDAADEICRLRAQIADAREACPSIRMQDHFDASLLELVNLEVSRGFNRDAEIHKLRAKLQSSQPTAGDLMLSAIDRWAEHEEACDLADCAECDAKRNQFRLARKVWQSSTYRSLALLSSDRAVHPEEGK